jgi:hypothetical protein
MRQNEPGDGMHPLIWDCQFFSGNRRRARHNRNSSPYNARNSVSPRHPFPLASAISPLLIAGRSCVSPSIAGSGRAASPPIDRPDRRILNRKLDWMNTSSDGLRAISASALAPRWGRVWADRMNSSGKKPSSLFAAVVDFPACDSTMNSGRSLRPASASVVTRTRRRPGISSSFPPLGWPGVL